MYRMPTHTVDLWVLQGLHGPMPAETDMPLSGHGFFLLVKLLDMSAGRTRLPLMEFWMCAQKR